MNSPSSIETFLAHLVADGKAPSTVEAYARDLRDLFEWRGQREWNFRELSLEQLAEFFGWLRRPEGNSAAGGVRAAERTGGGGADHVGA